MSDVCDARTGTVVADALENPRAANELVWVADRETALGEARLTSELARCRPAALTATSAR